MIDLTDDEKRALIVARDATYRPGIVAAQTWFHGKPNEKGQETDAMLGGLRDRGLLTLHDVRGPHRPAGDPEGTRSIEYELTEYGWEVARGLGPMQTHAENTQGELND